MKKIKTSRSLMEVWEWKDDAYKEVMNLDIDVAIKKRLETSLETTKAMGFHLSKPFKTTDSRRLKKNTNKGASCKTLKMPSLRRKPESRSP